MRKVYQCEFCDEVYESRKACAECEKSHYKIEEIANLDYYILKYAYPRLKLMMWYDEYSRGEKDKLVELMGKYLTDEFSISKVEIDKMYELFGKLLPRMWN